MNLYPPQRKAKRDKLALAEGQVVPDWIRQNTNYFLNGLSTWDADRAEMSALRRAAEGVIDNDLYANVLNPMDSDDPKFLNKPAALRNYDFISSIVRSFLGERSELPLNYTVVARNADSQTEYKKSLSEQVKKNLVKQAVNQIGQHGVNTGIPPQQTIPTEQVVEKHRSEWDDERAQMGQSILNYVEYDQDLKDKYQDALFDYISIGRAATYKEVRHNDIHTEIVPFEELFVFNMDKNKQFIEDAGGCVRWSRASIATIIDKWRNTIKEDDLEFLENELSNYNGQPVVARYENTGDNVYTLRGQDVISGEDGLVDLFHITWKSQKKVGILTYRNEIGLPLEMEVDETYRLDKALGDISISWEWINEVWEIWVAGDTTGRQVFLEYGPHKVQRNELDNSSECKLPYNGRIGYTTSKTNYSIVKQLIPYQLLYNIYHYRFEILMATNKDKMMLLPFGLKPEGWSMQKWNWYADYTKIAWFDETNPNLVKVLNAIKGIDMGLGTYIESTRNLMLAIKQEAMEAVGFNRQRLGDVKASDRKGNTEHAIYRSSIITAEIMRRFDKLIEKDLAGILDYSKLAYLKGKKGQYFVQDKLKFLDVDGIQNLETSYGLFVKNTAHEKENLDAMKEFAFSFAQNDRNPAMIAQVINAKSMSNLVGIMEKFEEQEKMYQQQTELAKGEQEAKLKEMDMALEQLKGQFSMYSDNTRYKGQIDSALIQQETELIKNGLAHSNDDSAQKAFENSLNERKLLSREAGLK